ncbi:MAG TPA: DsrE family protein [Burkholderiaceae bacterium]|nr:DsrE family protein [Burkholderiaceae bacterium]
MPQKILIVIHAPPYGSERCLSALRVANSLAGLDGDETPDVRVFLMSDATVLALPNQQDGGGSGLQKMVEELVSRRVPIVVCRTCALARGLGDLPLIAGTRIGTLAELAQSTLWADKVVTF